LSEQRGNFLLSRATHIVATAQPVPPRALQSSGAQAYWITMTLLNKTLLAATALTVVTSSAFALHSGDWMRHPGDVAHVYAAWQDFDGADKNSSHPMMMRGAQKAPRNSMFFMVDGELYMQRRQHARQGRQLHGRRSVTPVECDVAGGDAAMLLFSRQCDRGGSDERGGQHHDRQHHDPGKHPRPHPVTKERQNRR
jgi:hypothetical protein